MKIKDGFVLRDVMGQHIIVAEGATSLDFNKIISLNDSATLLWNYAIAQDFTNEDLAQCLVNKYGIDFDTALADATEISDKWIENGLAEI